MALKLEDKKRIISRLENVIKTTVSIVSADTSGISVERMMGLRKAAREADVTLMVVKNTLARKVLKDSAHHKLAETLKGPCLLGFSHQHPGAAAKLFEAFSKENKTFVCKHGVFENQVFDEKSLKTLASIPTYEEALSQLLGALKEVIGGKLARTLVALNASRTASEQA